jgi:hypothetical protein
MIEDSLGKRKHVVDYDTEVIPTENEIEEILRTAYPLVTSKQKAYPYKFYVLGPNKKRSNRIWNLAEGNKINVDTEAYGDAGDAYVANPGLFHMVSAPWTLIVTPRIAPPNPYYRRSFDNTKSLWQLEDSEFINKNNRESMAIEVGMLAKAITGAALDRGWDTSYNICFIKDMEYWNDFPYLKYRPTLIQTLGKGKKYLYETLTQQDQKDNTDPLFETIFEFVDREKK